MNHEGFAGSMRNRVVFTLLIALILPIYLNSLNAAWQFDDKPNIVNNPLLHLEDLSPRSLGQTFFAMTGKKVFYRPLPYLSFGLNWYFGQENTLGYHLVNLAIHVLTAFCLYLAVGRLLRTPGLADRFSKNDVQFIALLSSVLWAVNPIQVQAVTYIVQRMAAMAALFYILGIFLYLQARLHPDRHRQWAYGLACLLTYPLAYLSKENAAIFPLSVLLLEIIFFWDPAKVNRLKQKSPHLFQTGVVLALGIFLMAAILVLHRYAGSYGTRPYTMLDRLLTQSRVVLFYLSQLFYPLPSRLSIAHDVVLSKSLLVPWTTLPAIATIAALIGLAFWRLWQISLAAFAVLFFFLNHVVESSVIPLELIFEHRNYLPSLFLFLPVAAGILAILKRYRRKNRFLHGAVVGFVVLLIIGWGHFTYLRNQAWQSETALWSDAMQKAPNDARPISNVAIELAWGNEPSPIRSEMALKLLERAQGLTTAHTFLDQDIVYNMGAIYVDLGRFAKAIDLFRKTLRINPTYLKARYHLVQSLIMTGDLQQASAQADVLINNRKKLRKSEYYNIKGFILLWQDTPEDALPYFQKALDLQPDNASARLNAGVTLSRTDRPERAERYFVEAIQLAPGDIRPFFGLIENRARANDPEGALQHARLLFKRFTLGQIRDSLRLFSGNYRTAPLSVDRILPIIEEVIRQTAEALRKGPYEA